MISESYLIQRIKAPFRGAGTAIPSGGLLSACGADRKLSDAALSILRGIWSLDYMGAAEFEFGAVPRSLGAIMRGATDYAAWAVEVDLSTVPVPHRWGMRKQPEQQKKGSAALYVIGRTADRSEIDERIRFLAANKIRTKEITYLIHALQSDPGDEHGPRAVGWLDLDNDFLFFVDQEMWAKACAAFLVARLDGKDAA